MDDVLITIISGKRPGGEKERPTEKLKTEHDRIYVSNNADGYVTEIPVVMVPKDFREKYIAEYKNSENAWYAPMNRSYAIKYAREKGYRYLVQLDDNINYLEICYLADGRRMRAQNTTMLDDFCRMFVATLKNTNAAMVGCALASCMPDDTLWREGYVYSLFMLDLKRCPDYFQGDFEDDIEYRLKCAELGRPVIQLPFLRYSKTSQGNNKDLTGCRAEYAKQGLKRGKNMSVLYADVYSCSMTTKNKRISTAASESGAPTFKHMLKPFKVGVIMRSGDEIRNESDVSEIQDTKKRPMQG